MNSTLDKFLNKINYPKLEVFKDTIVTKVEIDKNIREWTIYIKNKTVIAANEIEELKVASKNGFDDVASVKFIIMNDAFTDADVLSYVKYYLTLLSTKSPALKSLNGAKIEIKGKEIFVEVANEVENNLIKKFNDKISNWLSISGFSGYTVSSSLNNAKREEVKKEIESIKTSFEKEITAPIKETLEVKKEAPIKEETKPALFGVEFDVTKRTLIRDIESPKRGVVIYGKIENIRFNESTKSDYKIFTIRVSDESGEFTSKLFTTDKNVCSTLLGNLQEGKSYYFKGSIQEDSYSNSLVLIIRNIMDKNNDEAPIREESKENKISVYDDYDYGDIPEYIPSEEDYNDAAFFAFDDDFIDETYTNYSESIPEIKEKVEVPQSDDVIPEKTFSEETSNKSTVNPEEPLITEKKKTCEDEEVNSDSEIHESGDEKASACEEVPKEGDAMNTTLEEIQIAPATSHNETVLVDVKKENSDNTEKQIPTNENKKEVKNMTLIDNSNINKNHEKNLIMGSSITTPPVEMKSVQGAANNVCFEAEIFGIELFESSKTNFKIITLKLTDLTDSFFAKIFTQNTDEFKHYAKMFKEGNWIRIEGSVKFDEFTKDLVLNARNIISIPSKRVERTDDAPIKRVELHTHTMMSQMDGVLDANKYLMALHKMGYRSVAITDHNGVQAFPDAFHRVCEFNKGIEKEEDKFKCIYGAEMTMIEDTIGIVKRETDTPSLDATYCVFDLETTGFNAGGKDSIIEIGAVLLKDGQIISKFDELINPGRSIPKRITEITNITDDMLKDKDTEENAVKRFIEFMKDYPLVAHNAKFDTSFLEMAFKKYNLGELKNTVIDTLELSRALDNGFARHGLSALVKRYNVEWDEDAHHRADYDAEGTAKVFAAMIKKMDSQNISNIKDFNSLVKSDEIYKYGRSFHINLLAKNKTGLKNLFKLISLASTKYLFKTARILRSEVEKYREGLLIGSGCYESEVFLEAKSKSDEELANIVSFYDYVEVQPPEVYGHLLQTGDFFNELELQNQIRKIIDVTKNAGKIIVASGDVHHFNREDKLYREIIVNQKVPGGGRHPLAKSDIREIPSQHFRTTNEMLSDFSFIDKKLAEEIIITNTNKISDMCEILEVIIDTGGIPFSPKIDNSKEEVKNMVYENAHKIYGDNLPELIENRIETELKGIIKGGFDVIYLIAQKLVKHSNDEGYLVGSRGSVGSSFVATMMNITEVNPLPAHYVCPNCKYSEFGTDNREYALDYSCGYDLPDKLCPRCNEKLSKQGQDMPFATFLGFDADKVPDIDLNFSGDNQASAHEYTKVLFGVDNVYRAGTISTVASKTAYGFVKGYCEDKGIMNMRNIEMERLSAGCTGVKRTTGQHPGGIVVIPGYMDVYDFTPFQFPADDLNSAWRTTHFDYHAIDQDVLKLDMLGHDDPTVLRMIKDLSGIDVTKVPLDDKDTMKIFTGTEILGVKPEDIESNVGTLGIPEFGTKNAMRMLEDTKPTRFAELVKISGLSHGTDVWYGNARDLIMDGVVEFKDVIGCRDDIMINLINYGMESKIAFKIMEFVRKGKASKDLETWAYFAEEMKKAEVPDWYINSCAKIKYMFPKAHAAAYVISAYRIAWFKVHKPVYFYASYFSVRTNDFDIVTMCAGYDAVKKRLAELNEKGYDIGVKEASLLDELWITLEMYARGYKFKMIDLNKSDGKNFVIDDDGKSLIFPFRGLDGLGDNVARAIVEERNKAPFLSIEDVQSRAKVNSTTIEKMRTLHIFDGMSESNQLSLFD